MRIEKNIDAGKRIFRNRKKLFSPLTNLHGECNVLPIYDYEQDIYEKITNEAAENQWDD